MNERVLAAFSEEGERPTEVDLTHMREGLERWREQLAGVRQRIGSLLIEPPPTPH